ncbi:MAG: hypothetical protein NVSMB18_11550 [Acetobacteraceae bacterium]
MIDHVLGAQISERRKELGLEVDGLAREMSVPRDVLEAWEAGRERVPSASVLKLASILGCSIAYLFGREPAGEPANQRDLH